MQGSFLGSKKMEQYSTW